MSDQLYNCVSEVRTAWRRGLAARRDLAPRPRLMRGFVAALVAYRGGCAQYDQGGGREVLGAAGARLAVDLQGP